MYPGTGSHVLIGSFCLLHRYSATVIRPGYCWRCSPKPNTGIGFFFECRDVIGSCTERLTDYYTTIEWKRETQGKVAVRVFSISGPCRPRNTGYWAGHYRRLPTISSELPLCL